MQRNVTPGPTNRSTGADDEDRLEEPEKVPSFLTARELQAKDPAKGEKDPDPNAGEPEERTEKPQRKGPNNKAS